MHTFDPFHMNGKLHQLREALGAVAVGAPADYRVCRRDGGGWAVSREGEAVETLYPSQAVAMAAIHLAVVRCTSYRVSMQDDDGWHVIESDGIAV